MTLRLPLLLSTLALAVTGCPEPADDGEDVDDEGPELALTATLTTSIGPELTIDFVAECPVESLALVGPDVTDVATTGLGTTTVQLTIDMTSATARAGLLRVLDDVVVADVNVVGACEGGEDKTIAVGRAPFLPAQRQRTAPRGIGDSSFATIRIDLRRPDGFVLFHEGSSVVAAHADGTSYSADLGAIGTALDLSGLSDDYELGDLYIAASERGFYNDKLGEIDTTFNRFFTNPQVGDGRLYDLRVAGGEPGEAGLIVYDADGTAHDFTVEAAPTARSTSYADGTRHLLLVTRDDALVLIETDVTADDGIAAQTPFALPAGLTAEHRLELIVDDGARATLVASTDTEIALYDLDATFGSGATTFGTPTLLDTLSTEFARVSVQREFNGRLLVAADDGVYALESDGLNRIVTTQDPFITQAGSPTGEFMIDEADGVFVYAADGSARVSLPDFLTGLGSDVTFDVGIARNSAFDGYLIFDWADVLAELVALPRL